MRPRRMRLGYFTIGPQETVEDFRFNEAEAHAPRIHIDGESLRGEAARFNEAEAHAPRIRVTSEISRG